MNTEEKKRLLIIDDEANMRHLLQTLLNKAGYDTHAASNGYEGLEKIRETGFDYVLCDLKMPKMGGLEFLDHGRPALEASTVIMMSAYGTIETAVHALKKGAYDYISKPFKPDEVLMTLKKAEERERLRRENFHLKEQLRQIRGNHSFSAMKGKSGAMTAVFRLAEKVAQYPTTVLITGESGTGKELLAKGIHLAGPRKDGPWIAVNCGGIPENLLESEMFGYKKGAFTGADKDKTGLFLAANKGSLFLDEVGELPLSLQVKLLRVLQENEVRPIGDSKAVKTDVRIIAATSKNLAQEIKTGLFRQDLFYRLNVMPITLPPLRERKQDIPLLCAHFLDKFSKRIQKKVKSVSSDAMAGLLRHGWPGNVRELENAMERAVVLAETDVLVPENFPFEISGAGDRREVDRSQDGYSLKTAKERLEKNMIIKALMATGGNRTRASKILEISHPSLLSKIKAYGIAL